jgi:hypothetical protein
MMEKTIMNLDNGIPIEDEMIRMLLLILIRQYFPSQKIKINLCEKIQKSQITLIIYIMKYFS